MQAVLKVLRGRLLLQGLFDQPRSRSLFSFATMGERCGPGEGSGPFMLVLVCRERDTSLFKFVNNVFAFLNVFCQG